MAKEDKSSNSSGIIPAFKIETIVIPIIGISPLVVHCFDQKSRIEIEEKEQKKQSVKASKHDVRNPEEEYQNSKHISPQGWEGFPAAGFKKSILRGAKILELVMKDIQTQFFIVADDEEQQLVRIYGESRMRTDMVKIGMGSSTVRYRAEYPSWSAELKIQYISHKLSIKTIEQLVKAGGTCAGVGEMRREKTSFNYGQYDIDEEKYTL